MSCDTLEVLLDSYQEEFTKVKKVNLHDWLFGLSGILISRLGNLFHCIHNLNVPGAPAEGPRKGFFYFIINPETVETAFLQLLHVFIRRSSMCFVPTG